MRIALTSFMIFNLGNQQPYKQTKNNGRQAVDRLCEERLAQCKYVVGYSLDRIRDVEGSKFIPIRTIEISCFKE